MKKLTRLTSINHYWIFTTAAFVIIGCSSNDDNPQMTAPDAIASDVLPSDIAHGTERVFEVINGDAIEEMVAVQIQLDQAEELGFELLSTSFDAEISDDVDLFACPGGGTVGNSNRVISGGTTFSTNFADACVVGDIVVTGRFNHSTSFGRGEGVGVFNNSTFVDNYSLTKSSSGDFTSITSGGLRLLGRFDEGNFSQEITLTDFRFISGENISAENDFSVESAMMSISDSTLPLSGSDDGISLVIESLVTSSPEDTLTINTDMSLQFTAGISDPNPISGVINITGQNATWQIDFDGGDPESVAVTLNAMGSTIGFFLPKAMYSIVFIDPMSVFLDT